MTKKLIKLPIRGRLPNWYNTIVVYVSTRINSVNYPIFCVVIDKSGNIVTIDMKEISEPSLCYNKNPVKYANELKVCFEEDDTVVSAYITDDILINDKKYLKSAQDNLYPTDIYLKSHKVSVPKRIYSKTKFVCPEKMF